MALNGLAVGAYGNPIRLTCKEDGTAADISAYTTRQYIFTDPGGNATTKTATFNGAGTDGVLTYTVESDLFDEAGTWRVQVKLAATGKVVYSGVLEFEVGGVLA